MDLYGDGYYLDSNLHADAEDLSEGQNELDFMTVESPEVDLKRGSYKVTIDYLVGDGEETYTASSDYNTWPVIIQRTNVKLPEDQTEVTYELRSSIGVTGYKVTANFRDAIFLFVHSIKIEETNDWKNVNLGIVLFVILLLNLGYVFYKRVPEEEKRSFRIYLGIFGVLLFFSSLPVFSVYLKDGHGATSVLQSNMLNEKNALYIITCIKKVITKKFAYNDKATKIALKNTYIELPVTNTGKIDYSFMEKRIRELEEERIRELSTYLSISGLDSYELNSYEKDTIKQFQNNKVKYKVYKLGEGNERLFDISSPQKRFNANTVTFGGKYPYVVRSSLNNGIRGYITQDECYLNPAKTISFGQDTATIFYQEKPYFTGDKIKVMSYRDCELNPELAIF